MDNNNNKLQGQVDQLEKLIDQLTRRVVRLEQENKKLHSKFVNSGLEARTIRAEVGNIRAAITRR